MNSRVHDEPWRASPHTYAAVVSQGQWVAYPWLTWLGQLFAWELNQGNARIIINAPPRHGKSGFISQWLPVWFLDMYPERNVILASYGAELAHHFGRWVRNEISTSDRVVTELREDSKAANRWNTGRGGGMVAVGVGGPLSGFGADLLLIDDPTKNWEQAYSASYQNKVREWYSSTFYTRAEPGASMIIAMTRWSEDDLSGHILGQALEDESGDNWYHVRLPAMAEDRDLLGRKKGSALCPERYDVSELRRIKVAVGAAWEPMYQQDPEATGPGSAYSHYSKASHVLDDVVLIDALPLCLCLDFNSNPGMHGIVGQYAEAGDQFMVSHVIHGPRMPIVRAPLSDRRSVIDDLVDLVEREGGWKWPELWIFGDATGKSTWPGTSESCYQVLVNGLRQRDLSPRIRVPAANPPVRDRIDAVNSALRDTEGVSHVAIHPRCERLIRDLSRVRLAEDGSEDQSNSDLTHASAAFGYWVHYLRPVRVKPDDMENARFGVLV